MTLELGLVFADIPKPQKRQLGQEGAVLDDDDGFAGFLQEILATDALDKAAAGITKKVIAEGREALSKKQEHVFQTSVLDIYTVEGCEQCSNEVPWSEMLEASDNGGLCSWCAHMNEKDD